MNKHLVTVRKKEVASKMLSIVYSNVDDPDPYFLSDLEEMIEGKITEDEMRSRILRRYHIDNYDNDNTQTQATKITETI